MPRVNHNADTFWYGETGIIPRGHSYGHITSVDGNTTVLFANGDTYTVADGEVLPLWHIGEPCEEISVTAPEQGYAKCFWIMS